MHGVVITRGSVDVERQRAALSPGRVLLELMFFSLELSLSRVAVCMDGHKCTMYKED